MSHPFSDPSPVNPYERDQMMAPQGPPRRTGCWVFGIIAFILFSLFMCCGGFGLLGFYGLGVMTDEIEEELKTNPVLVEQIGEVQSIELDFVQSMETDDDVWVYSAKGTEGNGTLVVEHITGDDGLEHIQSAILRKADGTEVDLMPAETSAEK